MTRLSPWYSQFPELVSQNFTLDTVGGPVQYSTDDIQSWYRTSVQTAVMLAVTIGGGIIVAILVLLQAFKRVTPVNVLSLCALFSLIIHSGFSLNFYLSGWNTVASQFAGTYAQVTLNDLNVTVAASMAQAFLITFIELNLGLQLFIVLQTRPLWRYLITAAVFSIASLPVIVIVFTYSAVSAHQNIVPESFDELTAKYHKLFKAENPIFAASVCVYAIILTAKLGVSLKRRRDLGLKQFDAFQIIFIMTAQTLVIPAIFTILAFALPDGSFNAMVILTPFLVVISLPLSSMWASLRATSPNIVNRNMVPTSDDFSSMAESTAESINIPVLYKEEDLGLGEKSHSQRDSGDFVF